MSGTERQRLSRQMNWGIRLICGIYSQAKGCSYLTVTEQQAIVTICDNALFRIRGESETSKRQRERAEIFSNIEKGC